MEQLENFYQFHVNIARQGGRVDWREVCDEIMVGVRELTKPKVNPPDATE